MKSKRTCIHSGKSKCIYKCRWKKTGMAIYTDPLQEEEECQTCHRKRWKEGPKIETKHMEPKEWEEYRKKFITEQ